MNDLKPCPFCGSANVHAYSYKEAVYRQYAVKCKKCGARIMAQSTELAIEKWNRRAERKKGDWMMDSYYPDRLICSECTGQFDVWHWESKQMHFCPNCGADTRGEYE